MKQGEKKEWSKKTGQRIEPIRIWKIFGKGKRKHKKDHSTKTKDGRVWPTSPMPQEHWGRKGLKGAHWILYWCWSMALWRLCTFRQMRGEKMCEQDLLLKSWGQETIEQWCRSWADIHRDCLSMQFQKYFNWTIRKHWKRVNTMHKSRRDGPRCLPSCHLQCVCVLLSLQNQVSVVFSYENML